MYIEKWKDTAFGSDYGHDFLEFMENIETEILSLEAIFKNSDLNTFLQNRKSFLENIHGQYDITLINTEGFEQTLHYEEAIIALSAVIIECELNGSADVREAYGNKILKFNVSQTEIDLIKDALKDIHDHPESFFLFSMLPGEEKTMTLDDISDMLNKMDSCKKTS